MIYKKEKTVQCKKTLTNPGRGMLQIFYYNGGEEWSYEEAAGCMVDEESLILLVINIGRYRNDEIPSDILTETGRIIDFFKENKKDIIVRPVYDSKGQALLFEPSDFELLKRHAAKLCNLFKEKNVFMIQGLFIGNWGEMHGSRYTDDIHLREIYGIMREYAGEDMYLAVRCPYHYRILCGSGYDRKLGLFDDAILSSETDMGTFAPAGANKEHDVRLPFEREEELDFENKICRYAPNGGEAVYGDGYVNTMGQRDIVNMFTRMRLTYLNRLYDRNILDIWEREKCTLQGSHKEESFLDYIKDHLGYRLVLRDCRVKEIKSSNGIRQIRITLKIQNTGFAPVYINNKVRIILKGEKILTEDTGWNLCDMGSGRGEDIKTFEHVMEVPKGKGEYGLYIFVYTGDDNRPVLFSNLDPENKAGIIKFYR